MSEPITQWEFAALLESRSKRRRLRVVYSRPDIRVRPRKQRLRGVSRWTALGLLGAEGWELIGLRGRDFYFKRSVSS